MSLGLLILLVFVAGESARPALIDAAKNVDRDAVRALLQQGINVNAADADGTTALHWASYRDDVETADLLIRAGANVNAANDLGATPLWAASQNGSEAMVRRLLTGGANPNAALLLGETPLMVAARSGHAAVVELLAAKGANVNARAARGQTALMWTVAQKHPQVVSVLLAHDADINARSDTWGEVMAVPPHGYLDYNRSIPHGNDTALMFAARVGDIESAKLLVAAGANVNDEDAWGVSAVVLAAHSGFTELVEYLLEKGANVNSDKAGFTALHEAIMRRDEKLAKILLDHGADANAPVGIWTPSRRSSHDFNFEPELIGATPFWLAARFTEPEVMRLLVSHGADPLFVHRSDKVVEGRGVPWEHRRELTTAVMAAAGMGGGGLPWTEIERGQREALALEAVKVAVELGVDVNASNTDGRTALDSAKALKFDSVVAFLTEKGGKPGAPKGKLPEPAPQR